MPGVATRLLFVDGIGVGRGDPETNPFAAVGARRFAPLAARPPDPGWSFRPLDATLGVKGLPQSATGQTTILTGVNAARLLGRHLPGLPGPSLRPLLERESLFLKLVRLGRRPTFANAYTPAHLHARRKRWSASTRMVVASGVPFRMMEEEGLRGEALFHDYTGEWLRRRGFLVPRRDARDAGRTLLRLLEAHDLVLYEYFLTDLAGHRGDRAERERQARRAEDLVDAVVADLDAARHTLVAISDHGNLEDASHDRHTLSPVPLVAWGAASKALVARVDALASLTPALVESDGSGTSPR